MESIGGDEEEAIRKIEVPCFLNLGVIYKAEKKIDNALAEFTKVLEIQNGEESDQDLTGYKDWFVTFILNINFFETFYVQFHTFFTGSLRHITSEVDCF